MGPITGVGAGDNSFLLNSLLPQHARHRLRGIRLAKLIEKPRAASSFLPSHRPSREEANKKPDRAWGPGLPSALGG